MTDTEAFDAAVEEIESVDVDQLEFCGEPIAIKPLPSILLLKFSKFASRKIGAGDMEGMAVMYDLIKGVVLPSDWDNFERLATDNAVDGQQLFEFVVAVMKANTGRPTRPQSSSPKSASDDSPKSKSESVVVDLGDGRIVEMEPGETAAQATARAILMDTDDWDQELQGIQAASEQVIELEG